MYITCVCISVKCCFSKAKLNTFIYSYNVPGSQTFSLVVV